MILESRNKNGELIFTHEFIEPNIIYVTTFYYQEGDAVNMMITTVDILKEKLKIGDPFHFIKNTHESFYINETYTRGDLAENTKVLDEINNNWKQLTSIDIIKSETLGYRIFVEMLMKVKNSQTEILNFTSKEEAFEYVIKLNESV